MIKRKKGYFSISAVAEMFSIHQQTIRLYEREGLINPKRSEGNTRLFSEEDVNRLEEIIHLTHQLGINLAGVEMILKLKKQMSKLQNEINNVLNHAQKELTKQEEINKYQAHLSAQTLASMKKSRLQPKAQQAKPDQTNPSSTEVNIQPEWHIDYEE